jgi:hypothetical protein
MSKWSKLKVALLTAATMLSALQLGACLGDNAYQRILQYVVVGTLFD